MVDGRANHFVIEQRSTEFDFLADEDAKGGNHANTAVLQLSLTPFADVSLGFSLIMQEQRRKYDFVSLGIKNSLQMVLP